MLCTDCSQKTYIASIGLCVGCAQNTAASGSHRMCPQCSKQKRCCEHCEKSIPRDFGPPPGAAICLGPGFSEPFPEKKTIVKDKDGNIIGAQG